tara:strand:- start:315 stop:647 length:333 start_codon:yes stop_codon:yes gene_type:complete
MTTYFEITSDQAYPNGHVLLAKDNNRVGTNPKAGALRKVIIANHAGESNTIQLFLDDGAGSPTRHTIVKTIIPSKTTLVVTDGISFDITKYSLKLSTTDTSTTALTVILK